MMRAGVRRLPGGYRVDVVGESFYASALIEIAGLSAETFGGKLMWASRVPDPSNPYDRNAVKVMIDGKQIGHLSKEAAIVFRPVVERITELGCEVECAATLLGGGGKKGSGLFGVVLDLGTPEACLKELESSLTA